MALSVLLAGYNIDADLLAQTIDLLRALKSRTDVGSTSDLIQADAKDLFDFISERLHSDIAIEAFTPETISAAYARISRDPQNVTELRKAARFGVARARKSNENIIFGLGHASVAEHATFNFDVSGISRLASEALQSHRLLSFTEKSQRYITIGEDYVIPPEAEALGCKSRFEEFIPELFAGYTEVYSALREKYLSGCRDSIKKSEEALLEGRAKEDARYLLPLACSTQMGMTMNARNTEHVIADLSDHPLAEFRELGRAIHKAVGGLAPSLVKYVQRGNYPRRNRDRVAEFFPVDQQKVTFGLCDGPSVRVIDFSPDGEDRILRGLAFSCGHRKWVESVRELDSRAREQLWLELFRDIRPHDSVLREFELIHITFEIEVSAACFGQLKRHRMATLLSQPYNSADGAIIPPSVRDAGLVDRFSKAIDHSNRIAGSIHEIEPKLAPYLLTNAHKKRVLMQASARELYHFARLRSDSHAQWEIRELSIAMLNEANRIWPNALMMACGKDKFDAVYCEQILEKLSSE
jgi:flavin-dependent thymidylate synthase